MHKIKGFLRRIFTPVSIMFVPYDCAKTFNIRLPVSIVFPVLLCAIWLGGAIYVVSAAVNTDEYHRMKNELASYTEQLASYTEQLSFYTGQFIELKGTMSALKKTETELKRIVSLGSREKILENITASATIQEEKTNEGLYNVDALDMDLLKNQIKDTINRVSGIREFLKEQRNIHMTTPRGWPVYGRITSPFGTRIHPVTGMREFHRAIDIAAPIGTPIRAVADGIVDFVGWSKHGGKIVIIEHRGIYRTVHAHNSKNLVTEGQKVKRGDIIAYVGNTGRTTGPHLSFEIRRNGKSVNPWSYIMTEDIKIVLKKEKQ